MHRRLPYLMSLSAGLALSTAALAGCSSGPPADPNATVKVTSSFGASPVVHIPDVTPGTALHVQTAFAGHGGLLAATGSFLGNVALYDWHGTQHKLIDSTFGRAPQVLPAQPGLPGLNTALQHLRTGSRVVAVVPPKDGYGPRGNTNLGIAPADTTVWVIDVIQSYSPAAAATGTHLSDGGGTLPKVSLPAAGQAPVVTIPASQPPKQLATRTLIKGSGAPVRLGQVLVVKFVGVTWRTGTIFQSNWPSAQQPKATPFAVRLAMGQLVPGWVQGLDRVPVGSRVLLVLPPSSGYGKTGNPNAGIRGTDTLVFVVDVLASVS